MKFTCVLFTILMLGCGYGSNYNNMNPPPGTTPNISQLSPNSVSAGGSAFVLTVNGTGFGMNAMVYWNSTAHDATYVTGNQITANISVADIANPGTAQVYVHSNGRNSNTMIFSID